MLLFSPVHVKKTLKCRWGNTCMTSTCTHGSREGGWHTDRLAHGSAGTRLGSSYSFFLYSESISSVVQALETSCSPQLLYRGLKPLPFNTDPKEMKMQLNMHEGEMVGWHHPFNGHEFEQTPGYSEGHGSLACCSPWGRKVRHNLVTEQLDVNVHSSFIQNSKKLHNPNAL